MKKSLVLALYPALTAAYIGSAHGLDINGFLTAGVTTHNQQGASYYGINDSLDFSNGSVFGLQISNQLGERTAITGQLIADGKEDFDIEAEWAYASLSLLPQLDVRAGRLRSPLYLMSDFMDVGYAYTWATLPDAVYIQNRISNFDGLDAIYTAEMGPVYYTVQPYFGATRFDYGEGAVLDLKNSLGVNVSANYNGFLTLRAGYSQAKVSMANDGINAMSGYTSAIPESLLGSLEGDLISDLSTFGHDELADQLSMDEADGQFLTVGAQLDLDSFSVIGEYAKRDAEGLLPNLNGYYTSLIYNGLSSLTPYVTWADLNTEDEKLRNLVKGSDPQDQFLKDYIAGFEANRKLSQQSVAVGTRYDFNYNTAFKVEWKRILPRDKSLAGFEGIEQSELKDAIDLLTLNATIVF